MKRMLILLGIIALFAGFVSASDCSYGGSWSTDWGDMTLTQSGNVVTGTYTHDSGKIKATVSGGVLTGKWSEYPSYAEPGDAGDVELVISSDCNSFTGKWRYGSTGDMTSTWTGTRKGDSTGSETGVKMTAEGSLVWKGMTEDKVSSGPDKDGSPDGHFSLTLNPSSSKTVDKILLETTDAKGNPAGGQYWDTEPNGYWVLGVEQPAGTRLNPTDKDIAKTITGSTTFELYASTSGYFNSGQYFKVVVHYTDGSTSEALTVISATQQTTTTIATQTTIASNTGNNAAGASDVLILDTSNHYTGGCGQTDTSKWTLNSDTQVTVFEVWHNWNSGEQTITFSIKKDGTDFASGTLYRAACDTYQKNWCNADLRINKVFPKGSYIATIPSARMCKDNNGNGVVRLYGPNAVTQTTTATPTTQPNNAGTSSTTAKLCVPGAPYAYIEDRTVDTGKEVTIPVIMCNAADLANMDLSITYKTSVLTFKDAEKGSLNANSLLESNEKTTGTIMISFAGNQGTSGDGSIAILSFGVTGSSGESSQISGTVNSASSSSGSQVSVNVQPGSFTVGSGQKGDCDGDGIVSSRDALAALQMSVEKIALDLCYDVTGDGKVDSSDAREILKKAVGG